MLKDIGLCQAYKPYVEEGQGGPVPENKEYLKSIHSTFIVNAHVKSSSSSKAAIKMVDHENTFNSQIQFNFTRMN
jgi:hypothetical protein